MNNRTFVVIKRSQLTNNIQAHRVVVPEGHDVLATAHRYFHDDFILIGQLVSMLEGVTYLKTVEHEYVFVEGSDNSEQL